MNQGRLWVLKRAVVVYLAMCVASDVAVGDPSQGSVDASIEIMSYNVENFFDVKHDEGKNDWEFLPVGYPGKAEGCGASDKACLNTDWTEEHFQTKLEQVADVVLKDRAGAPDILGVVEIENDYVVSKIAESVGMEKFVVTHSPDARGIDVAILYRPSERLTYLTHMEHEVRDAGDLVKPTRNLLEVQFIVGGKHKLIIFMNHWPSQAAPSETRLMVAKQLKAIMDERMAEDSQARIVSMGDYNVTATDNPHPIHQVFLNAAVKNPFWDVDHEFRGSSKIASRTKIAMAPGTYFFPPKFSWDQLDRFLVSQNLKDSSGLRVILDSYQVRSMPFMVGQYSYADAQSYLFGTIVKGVPKRYDHNTSDKELAGYSDHLPIVMKLGY